MSRNRGADAVTSGLEAGATSVRWRVVRVAGFVTLQGILWAGVFGWHPPKAPEPLKVAVGVWPGSETLTIARERGILEDERVRVVELTWTSAAVRAFANHGVDAAVLSLDEALNLRRASRDARVVMPMDVSDGADALMAPQGTAQSADLRGKRIGVEMRTAGERLLARALETRGIAMSEVTLIQLNLAETETALRDGEVDAVVTSEPWLTRLRAAGAVTLFDSKQMAGELYRVLVVRADVLEKRADDVARLVRAHFMVRDDLAAHLSEAELDVVMRREELSAGQWRQVLAAVKLPTVDEARQMMKGSPCILDTVADKVVRFTDGFRPRESKPHRQGWLDTKCMGGGPMRPFSTLRFRIPAVVLLVGVVLIWLGHAGNVRWRVGQRLQFLRHDAESDGTRLSGMAQHFFRKKLPRSADLEMGYASAAPDLDLGLIIDGQDIVRHATQMQWRGVRLAGTPLRAASESVKQARQTMSGRMVEFAGGDSLLAVYPFREGMGDSVGVVLLSYDLAGGTAQAKRQALYETVPQGLALLAGCLLIWGVLHVLVTEPVDRLLCYAREVADGKVPPAPEFGAGEFATVGRGMAGAVEKLVRTETMLLESSETERHRIGADLHDDVCQRITATQLKAGMMRAALAGVESTLASMAGEIEAELSVTAQVARGFARGLAPVALDAQGLEPALVDFGRFLERSFALRCDVSSDVNHEALPPTMKSHIFRIAQELATNAAKHAHGTFVSIRITSSAGSVRIEVENDGVPFADTNGKGLGLPFVRQRVRAMEGVFEIGPRAGRPSGTLAVCTIPLKPHKPPTTHPTKSAL